ncbi:hypothetical protein PLESTB_000754600 [Pleodorina starrii]|uniref:Uncharacterized protein n=1 Tax=Pleodorina starrii TaxID=330485 RepID=A0A9W6BKE3_9CHLO|nr:hypothetical protein PLESTM_001570400 [Pleodorina starrii]GLC53483.1 hypothetical protein PLESTB_000754600 [Pleodorina starrii]GLC69780.1 hypothetical protein PLESTF_000879900 [Pleodorina starrii]
MHQNPAYAWFASGRRHCCTSLRGRCGAAQSSCTSVGTAAAMAAAAMEAAGIGGGGAAAAGSVASGAARPGARAALACATLYAGPCRDDMTDADVKRHPAAGD